MNVGLQMYSVRLGFQGDPMGTLQKVAEIGYKYIELANHNAAVDPGTGFGISADKLKGELDSVGLKIIGGSVLVPPAHHTS